MDEWLNEIEARAEKATGGPWAHCTPNPRYDTEQIVFSETLRDNPLVGGWTVAEYASQADAEFVAASRTDIPRLVAEVRRLRAQIERLTVPLGESVARTLDKRLAETIRERDAALEVMNSHQCGHNIEAIYRQNVELRAIVERVEELHKPARWYTEECDHDDDCNCVESGWAQVYVKPDKFELMCATCSGDLDCQDAYEHLTRWPCPTIKALRGEGDE